MRIKVLWGAILAISAVTTPLHAQSGGALSKPEVLVPSLAVAAPRAKHEPLGNSVYHGASLPDTWNDAGLRRQILDYQLLAGKKLSVVTWFASTYENGRLTSWPNDYALPMQRVKRAGALSLIKFSTQDYAYDRTGKIATTKQIAAGVFDAYFEQAADCVKKFGQPIFISINHEMNGNWYPYSQAYAGSGVSAADFVAAWQRIVGIFRTRGADNVAWVWSPNVPDVGAIPAARYYPGDSYVDWVGVSFYSGNPMSGLRQIYASYASRKPIFITEWATAPEKSRYYQGYPGDAAWMTQFFDALQKNYPRVKAISWFQWNKGDGNYLLQRVPEQQKVYASSIVNPRYIDSAVPTNSLGRRDDALLISTPTEIVLNEAPRVENPQPQPIKTESAPVEGAPKPKFQFKVVPR